MKSMPDFDYKKIQSELSLYSALTNIYNAAKKIEAQKKKHAAAAAALAPTTQSPQQRDKSAPAAPTSHPTEHTKSPRDTSGSAEKRRRRKSELIDDFQFPVYTGVVFRPKKSPKYQEQPQQQQQQQEEEQQQQKTRQSGGKYSLTLTIQPHQKIRFLEIFFRIRYMWLIWKKKN